MNGKTLMYCIHEVKTVLIIIYNVMLSLKVVSSNNGDSLLVGQFITYGQITIIQINEQVYLTSGSK